MKAPALVSCTAAVVSLLISPTAGAAEPQPPPPSAPPPAWGQPAQPPAGYPPQPYGYPPYGYPPPPYGYGYYPPPLAAPGPLTRPYEEGRPIPEGYTLKERARRGPIVAGATTLGTLYMLSALAGSVAQDTGDGDEFAPLFIPVAGPFITIGTAKSENGGTFILMMDGIGQTAGAILLIYGLAGTDKILVRNDVATRRPKPELLVGARSVGLRMRF